MREQPLTPSVALDRALIRKAGEHLGTLAENAYQRFMGISRRGSMRDQAFAEYACLERLSRGLLDLVK